MVKRMCPRMARRFCSVELGVEVGRVLLLLMRCI
jgi:hypothetical protein